MTKREIGPTEPTKVPWWWRRADRRRGAGAQLVSPPGTDILLATAQPAPARPSHLTTAVAGAGPFVG